MGLVPTTPATFYNFKDEVISIPLIQLAAMTSAFKMYVKTGADTFKVVPKVRKLLKTPKGYAKEDILHHLETVLKQTHEHYGIK